MRRLLLSLVATTALFFPLLAGCPDSGETSPGSDLEIGAGFDSLSGGDADGGESNESEVGGVTDDGRTSINTDGGTDPDLGDGLGPTDGSDTADGIDGPAFFRIVTSVVNDGNSESLQVSIIPDESLGLAELVMDSLIVTANDTFLLQDFKIPTEFVLDTAQWPNGVLTLVATGTAGTLSGTDTKVVGIDNAPLRIEEVTPNRREVTNGDTLEVTVKTNDPTADVTVSFAALDTGFNPAAVTMVAGEPGVFLATYTLTSANTRTDGTYAVTVLAASGDVTRQVDELRVDLVTAGSIPFSVESGLFVPGALPAPDPLWFGSPVQLNSATTTILTGGAAEMGVNFTQQPNPAGVVGLIVGQEGKSGYYMLPLDESSGLVDIRLLMRSYAENELPPVVLQVRVALRDTAGRVSPYAPATLSVLPVGSGDIQVSLAWDSPTDVDLHVVEPGGCELYYGNKNCSSGGELDLDSNPACSIDGINNENAFWPPGAAPEGTYIVRADYFSNCSGLSANYTATINYCGITEVVTGSFSPGDADSGGAGDGLTIATFENFNCSNTIRGLARYQDRTFDRTGFKASTYRPIRYAVVELERVADGVVVATTQTDRFGRYEIFYASTTAEALQVNVWSRTNPDDGLRDIVVADHPKFKSTYQASSDPFTQEPGLDRVVDIDVPEDGKSGAFNIFDVIVDGHDLIRRMSGKHLGEIRAFWRTSSDTTDTLFCSDYLYAGDVCTELGALSVQGKDIDRDEFDDMVILEEVFKMVLSRQTRDDHPGGNDYGVRGEPTRAWTEGVSAFFAADVLDTQFHVNSQPLGVYLVTDMEILQSPFAFGLGETPDGAVSEYLVSATLWDLRDAGGTEVFDAVNGKRGGIYDTIFNYFPTPQFVDRGPVGVDFTDLLDGWFCRGWGGADAVGDILNIHRKFGYDFGGPENCPL